ncbi:TetR/AcrR family transcriptional regulator [Asinibacterium sp. OR53]|uniref:TetR/AcrR family transcriptional regulator n=1 Tax=Asinibacterium sp. OR53 TaxID=925409 RepID=UPI00047DEBF6|nr:TetR/AcrR family transcriptional regulator [Asinibacterium sp. OR53]
MDIQERIVLKAHELFMRYGIRSVSMDEIANHLGMSKKTIYQFFADKDALVESVIDIEISRTREDCSVHRQKSENPVHEIFLAVDMLQELLKSMNPSLMFDLEKYHARAFQKISEHKNRFLYDVIKSNLEKGIRDELYRPEINTDIMTRYRLATTFLLFNPELFSTGKYTLPQVMEEITDNFLYGLVTTKGLKLIQKYKQQRLKTKNVTYE